MRSTLQASNRSPLNSSKSKAMFSFSKGDRFPQLNSESRYLIFDAAPHSTRSKIPSANGPPHLDMVIRSTSRCNIRPSQQKELSISWSIHPTLWFREISQKRSLHRVEQIGLQVGLNLQSDCQPRPRKLQHPQGKHEGYDHESKTEIPITMVQQYCSGSWCLYFTLYSDQTEKIDSNGACLISKYKSKNSFKIPSKSPEK